MHTKAENCVRQKINRFIKPCAHTCKQCSLYKSQSTWECAHVDQSHVPPSTHPHSTINGQCKAPCECWCIYMTLLINGSLQWIMTTTERKKNKINFSDTENKALVGGLMDEVRKQILFDDHSSGVTNKIKCSKRQHVAAVVNAVSSTKNSIPPSEHVCYYVGAKAHSSCHHWKPERPLFSAKQMCAA